jgi:hypothetical protein
MSTEKLEKYKELYSEYVRYSVNLHNYHQVFIENLGLESGRKFRVNAELMSNICRQLKKASSEAHRENRENTKERRAKFKEMRANAKPRVMPRGKPKGTKNGKHFKPTEDSI